MAVAKAQQKPEDVENVVPQTEVAALMQKIEAMLKEVPPPTPHLTEEVRTALAAPLDPHFLRSRKGQGGKQFTYADLDYLERRATEVDPDWGAPAGLPMFTTTNNSVVCNVAICGVPRSATAGYYIPDQYEVWDNNKKQMVERYMTAEVAHTIVTRAQAAAERRVFAMFGLGAELWASNQEDAASFVPNETSQASGDKVHNNSQPRGEFREPTEKRIQTLNDLGIPTSVAKLINSWSRGKDANGYPISDVGETITALFAARGRDKGALSRKVWEPIVAEHAPYALAGGSDDDEWDED